MITLIFSFQYACFYIVQVYEVLDNAIDEAQAGFASNVDIILHTDGSVSISDNGRGVSLDSLLVFDDLLSRKVSFVSEWRSAFVYCRFHILNRKLICLQIPTDIHPVTGKSALETVLTVHHFLSSFGHVVFVCYIRSFLLKCIYETEVGRDCMLTQFRL